MIWFLIGLMFHSTVDSWDGEGTASTGHELNTWTNQSSSSGAKESSATAPANTTTMKISELVTLDGRKKTAGWTSELQTSAVMMLKFECYSWLTQLILAAVGNDPEVDSWLTKTSLDLS